MLLQLWKSRPMFYGVKSTQNILSFILSLYRKNKNLSTKRHEYRIPCNMAISIKNWRKANKYLLTKNWSTIDIVVIWIRVTLIGSFIWILCSQLVDCLGLIKRLVSVGDNKSLGVAFDVSQAHVIPSISLSLSLSPVRKLQSPTKLFFSVSFLGHGICHINGKIRQKFYQVVGYCCDRPNNSRVFLDCLVWFGFSLFVFFYWGWTKKMDECFKWEVKGHPS